MILTWKAHQWLRGELRNLVLKHGINWEYARPPELTVIYDPLDCYGWFDQDRVCIVTNVAGCTESDVLGTLKHEYKHYLQDPDRTDVAAYEAEATAAEAA